MEITGPVMCDVILLKHHDKTCVHDLNRGQEITKKERNKSYGTEPCISPKAELDIHPFPRSPDVVFVCRWSKVCDYVPFFRNCILIICLLSCLCFVVTFFSILSLMSVTR